MKRLTSLCCVLMLLGAAGGVRAGLLDDMGIDSKASREARDCARETPRSPPPNPAQHSGAEGVPPLPLPAVPLRRTEKKNPPRPPVLIAKLATADPLDWATNPSDVDNLLKWMAKELKVNFTGIVLPENQPPTDPSEIPVIYRTGHQPFSLTPDGQARMRSYLLNGGTLILDACCGKRDFAVAAMRQIETLIPERSPYRLTADHPLFRAYYDIKQIRYRPTALAAGARNNDPAIIGIDVGCRTAVFLFRFDISCGWDNLEDNDHHQCIGYETETAKLIGANLMAYLTSERNTAMALSKALSYVDESNTEAGKFIIAQARYTGLWKTREAGLSMLLNTFHEKTTTPVRFARKDVDLASEKLYDCPFVYLTGHEDFQFTPQERENLRRYLARGGILYGEACCGRAGFDYGFRREIKLVLESNKLEPLPPDHPLFRYPNRITEVAPRPALARRLQTPAKIPPVLYGISLNGNLAVIYSPFGLSCGWELAQCPYCDGIESNDALALGVNLLSFVITQ